MTRDLDVAVADGRDFITDLDPAALVRPAAGNDLLDQELAGLREGGGSSSSCNSGKRGSIPGTSLLLAREQYTRDPYS